MELQPQPLNLKQREKFAQLLEQAQDRKKAELESHYELERRTERDFLTKLAEEEGASKLIADIQKLDKQLDDTRDALSDLGFQYSSRISLSDHAPDAFEKALEEAQRSAEKERVAPLKEYDQAILSIWAADDAQAARELVENLL